MPLPIARFNAVPAQTFRSTLNVGVVAFHNDGIARVDFYWGEHNQMVTHATLNPQTGTVEYWVAIDPSQCDDGPLEVRAQVFAKTGQMRECVCAHTGGPLLLYPNGTERVMLAIPSTFEATLKAAAGFDDSIAVTVKLGPGTYRYPELPMHYGARERWLTLQPNDGVARDQAILTPGANPTQRMLRLRNITLRQNIPTGPVMACRSTPFGNRFWVDGCHLVGLGYLTTSKSTAPHIASGGAMSWYTDTTVRDTAATGLHEGVQLARNVTGSRIGGDFINHKTLSVNCRVDRMRFDGGVHPDVIQCPVGPIDNMIAYGVIATDVRAQGITLGDMNSYVQDLALVNIEMEKGQDAGENIDPQYSRLPAAGRVDNVYMRNVVSRTYPWELRGGYRTNLSIRGCQFAYCVKQPDFSVAGQDVTGNTFARAQDVFGANATVGGGV